MAKQILPNGIGNIVMYSLSTSINIPVQDVFDSAKRNNVPYHILARPQGDTGAFKKACTEIASAITRGGDPCVRKIIKEDDEFLTVVFEKRMPDTEEDIALAFAGEDYVPTYPPILRIIYSKYSGQIENAKVYHKLAGECVLKKVERRYNETRSAYTIKQMRATIQCAFDYYGSIKLRHNGGVNFIPHTKIKEWRNFTNFVEEFSGVEIMELSVGNTQHNKNTVLSAFKSSVNESLEDEIARLGGKCEGSKELNELVADFSKALKDYAKGGMRSTQKDALANMLGRFRETMAHAKIYRDLLDADLSSIDAQVDIAKKQLLKIVETFGGEE